MNLRRKVFQELAQMTIVPILLIGLGIYAFEFVIAGLMAKPELNFSIIGAFLFALALAYAGAFGLFADITGLDSIRVDHMRRRRGADHTVYDRPAVVFPRPKLLGFGYRLIAEELHSDPSRRLNMETVHLLVGDVDQRIAEMRATLGYFGGLLILLGLLGAFMGLMKTVHSVSDLIGAMDITGADGAAAFSKMIEGMKAPLNGMSVGFSSSLFGLLFSLSLSVVDRFVVNAMKAVRNEYEATLINFAQLDTTEQTDTGAGRYAGPSPHAITAASASDEESLRALRITGERIREDISSLNVTVATLAQAFRTYRPTDAIGGVLQSALEVLAQSQRDMVGQMSRFADAAVSASDARADSDQRILQSLDRQTDILREIEQQSVLARNLARFTTQTDQSATGVGAVPPGSRSGVTLEITGTVEGRRAPEKRGILARVGALAVDFFGFGSEPPPAPAPRTPLRPNARSMDPALLLAQQNTQALVKDILKRMDEAQRQDRFVIRELGRRQDALVAEVGDLARSISEVMRTHDVAPRDRLAAISAELANMQRASAHDLTRLEAQIAAARRTSERAEAASLAAASHTEALSDLAQRRSRP